MRIGVMGTGAMAAALGGAWGRAGHEVFVGGRDGAAAAALAGRIGAAGHGSEIAYERFGAPGAPPALLIMGAGAQMISWP
ncbi:NAD(P)-binding domain-containing protein, partial [Streptomyces sp. NPDC041003]|uniref:NAD(P)-binding domain-containing protein n=1 Tax=Streptomyces sp. NPDC041003 TaxID=3155730 RepID=UPI0033F721B4